MSFGDDTLDPQNEVEAKRRDALEAAAMALRYEVGGTPPAGCECIKCQAYNKIVVALATYEC